MLFLVEVATRFPDRMLPTERAEIIEQEASRGQQLCRSGAIRHIWRLPGQSANVAVWDCPDSDALHMSLTSLPAWPWMSVLVRPLATHPLTVFVSDVGVHVN
jgi:muconolactone D-isomerase